MDAISAREHRDIENTEQPTGLLALHKKIANRVKGRG